MRYAQQGGYTPGEQRRREQVRLQAAERSARGDEISEIAPDLRVTEGPVRRWHRAWRDGGTEALRLTGPVVEGAGVAGEAEPAAVGPAGSRLLPDGFSRRRPQPGYHSGDDQG
jgi:hypothetical protein